MGIKFVTQSVVTAVDGRRIRLSKGDAWDDADPVVKARPELFADVPEVVMTSEVRVAGVEQASAAPGEKRSVKKAAAKKAAAKSED